MNQTHRGGFKALCEQSVIEASQFMGVDAVGHPVTHPRLNVELIPTQFPIAAPWLTSPSAPCRGEKELFNKDIEGGVTRRRPTTTVFDPQLSESQFAILSRTVDSPGRLVALPGDWIPPCADPHEIAPRT